MTLLPLLARLEELDIHLQLVDRQLKVNAPKGKLTPDLLAQVKEKKEEIIAFLESNSSAPARYASIRPVEKEEYYVSSSAQKRMYFLQRMDLKSTVYNIPQVIPLNVPPEVIAGLEAVFGKLIRKHESLRTSFLMVKGEIVQRVHDEVPFQLTGHSLEGAPGQVEQVIREFVRPFALVRAPLLRAALIETGNHRHLLLVDLHHIISDGYSTDILSRDAFDLYSNETPAPLRIQYKDFAQWQSRDAQRDALQRQRAFWLKRFADEIPVLDLPAHHPRPRVQSFAGQKLSFEISPGDTAPLKKMALDSGFTLFSLLLALFNIFLAKLSGQEDIVVGTPVAARSHADLEDIIGMFVNTLPLRNYPDGEKSFRTFLSEVSQEALHAFENQDYPFEDLVEQVVVRRDAARNPLFDVMLVLQNTGRTPDRTPADQQAGGSAPRESPAGYEYENQVSRFDMSWSAVDGGDRIIFSIEYSTVLFEKETVLAFVSFFQRIVSQVLEAPAGKLAEISLIAGEEKRQILEEFNRTASDYPPEGSIDQLFEKQAKENPDRLAAAGKEEERGEYVLLTYRALEEKAGQLARRLQKRGSRTGAIVGIMTERSLAMVVGIFGILKAGAAYLPIDPGYPAERIQYLLNDSQANVLVTVPGLSGKWQKLALAGDGLLMVKENPPEPRELKSLPREASPHRHLLPGPDHRLAYIIYTSGSTGRPKGVMIQQRSVINLLYGLFRLYPLEEPDRYLLKTAYSFDVSVSELFGWILSGSALVLLEKGGEKDPAGIIAAIARHRISHINFVPTMFYAFSGSIKPQQVPLLSSLKYIFLAGEELKGDAFDHYRDETVSLCFANLYGPTEGTVYASRFDFTLADPVEKIPIGKPLPGVQLFIRDRWGEDQPVGVAGELCIAGAGVARGYLNQPELTAKRFVELKKAPGEALYSYRSNRSSRSCIYLTGDLARWLPDGNIEFLGRLDNQVKLRGFRIELAEIESRLLGYPAVQGAAVLLREREGQPLLCAYIVAGESAAKTVLRDYLSSLLPAYMIPDYFIPLERFPLTASGKIDRSALPEPEVETGAAYVAPANETEEKLCRIWSEILGVEEEKIGTAANFFEMGGNSVKLIILASRINNAFGIEVPIAQLYNSPSIAEISKSLISGRFTNQPVILLNRLTRKKIFCFPPQIGYGYSYMSLASLISDYSLYGFAFIEAEDRLDRYVKIITELQPEGPYILMGHSAAGRLTFQVTKRLEEKGHEVSDILFCDCFFSGDAPDLFDKKYEEYMKNYHQYIDDFLETWNASFLKSEVIEKTNLYMNYCHNVTHLEKVNANIHLIRSQEARDYAAEDWHWDPNCWNELTGKEYRIYEGWGEHAEMLDLGALEQNVEIIRKILAQIDGERRDAVSPPGK